METLFIGKQLLFLDEVDSTNTYAINLLRNVKPIEGTVVYTDNQTMGRGQRGSSWSSEIAANLTLSCILNPAFLKTENSFYLSKITALALHDLLTEILNGSQYDIKIKWPNDILVNREKIAGILIENQVHKMHIQHSVIGIGLNVNQKKFSQLEHLATSLHLQKNNDYDKNDVLKKLCSYIEKWYLKLKANKLNEIDEFYLSNLFMYQQKVEFMSSNNVLFSAKIIGIETSGKLELELENQMIKIFDLKEVKLIF